MRGGYQAAAMLEPLALRAHVDDGLGARLCSQSPAQLHQLGAAVGPPQHRRSFRRPDLVARLQVRPRRIEPDGQLQLAEALDVLAVGDSISVVVTHCKLGDEARRSAELPVNRRAADRTAMRIRRPHTIPEGADYRGASAVSSNTRRAMGTAVAAVGQPA